MDFPVIKKPGLPHFGSRGIFVFAMLMLLQLRMPSCEAQVLTCGRDLDDMVVTFDLGLVAFGDKSHSGPDQWFVRWNGLIFEYEFMQKRVAMLYGINATGILSASVAFGITKGFDKDELGMEVKTIDGVLILPIDITLIQAYSYRKRDMIISASASVGLGLLLPVLGGL